MTALPCQNSCSWLLSHADQLYRTVSGNSTPTAGSLPYISACFTQWVATVHPQQETSPISLSASHSGWQQYTHSRKPPLYLCLLHTVGGNSTPTAGSLPYISVCFTQWVATVHPQQETSPISLSASHNGNSTPTAGSLPYISVCFTQWVATVHTQQEASPISLSTSHNGLKLSDSHVEMFVLHSCKVGFLSVFIFIFI